MENIKFTPEMTPAGKPKSDLGWYRLLSPTAGVRVSPLCIGAMSFGDKWDFMGTMSKEEVYEFLDYYYENDGNFIDTASNYQAQTSEKWIGEWMESRNNRDEMVIATKYTSRLTGDGIRVNKVGNSLKNLHISVENSLKNLKTSYIDILYLHFWDWSESIPNIMQALNNLVRQGKVLYLGISDSPAWIISKANEYARNHGLAQFVVYQGRYSIAQRSPEIELFDMMRHEGMGFAPYNVLGGGKFKDPGQDSTRKSIMPASEEFKRASEVMAKIAKEKNTTIPAIALAYSLHKGPYLFPIIGGRKLEHLKANIDALKIRLSKQDMEELDSAAPNPSIHPYECCGHSPTEVFPFMKENISLISHPKAIEAEDQ